MDPPITIEPDLEHTGNATNTTNVEATIDMATSSLIMGGDHNDIGGSLRHDHGDITSRTEHRL